MELIFATGNPDKLREVNQMLKGNISIKGLKDIGCTEDIPETQPTIAGNAIQKAQYVYDHYGVDCFAEDTGLEIRGLGMRPGVMTARYAGNEKDPRKNMDKVLSELRGEDDRSARFRTVIAYVKGGKAHTFEGVAEGRIATEKMGDGGFGYDPIFIPEGYGSTFAQLSPDTKNGISHRGKAWAKFIDYLLAV